MKKNVIALILSFAVAAGSICTSPVYAAENGVTAVETEMVEAAGSEVTAVETEMVEAAESEELLEDEPLVEDEPLLEDELLVEDEPLLEDEQLEEEPEDEETAVSDESEEELPEMNEHEDAGKQSVNNEPFPSELPSETEDSQQDVISEETAEPEEVSNESHNSDEEGFKREGVCGDDVRWVLTGTNPDTDPDLTLTISGTGDIEPYSGDPYFGNSDWTLYNSVIRKVVIEKNVTGIGAGAFSGFHSLESISIPNTVTSIGRAAFSQCYKLDNVTIPNAVTSIGDEAFYGCSALTNIMIPDGVTSIEEKTFWKCQSLVSAAIPDSVTSIGNSAFSGCSSLKSITIPDGVTSIGNSAFYGCSSLRSVIIPDGVTSIESSTFSHCRTLLQVTIPDSVKEIGEKAFYYCDWISNVTIPNSVTEIGSYAFSYCESLLDMTIPDSVINLGSYAFSYCTNLASVKISARMTEIRSHTFYGCSNLMSAIIPANVTYVGFQVFVPHAILYIYGYSGSYAQKYAKDNDITFVDLNWRTWVNNRTYLPYDTVAIQEASTKRYITCDVGGQNSEGRFTKMDDPDLNADATAIKWYEGFELVPCSDRSFALRSIVNRKYITCYFGHRVTDSGGGNATEGDVVSFLMCDSDFVHDGASDKTVVMNGVKYQIEAAYVKLLLSVDSTGTIKFKNCNRWLYVDNGKLYITDAIEKSGLFDLILVEDKQYTEPEQSALSKDEWFNIDNREVGGLFNIQQDIGKNDQFSASTLRGLGYTIMNIEGRFKEHEYIKIDEMQCFVAYRKTDDLYDVIIAFQGTDGFGFWDWLSDVMSNLTGNILPTYTDERGMHAGYHKMSMKLEEHEDSIIDKNTPEITLSSLISDAKAYKADFTILGHSMGGAIAQCYALHLSDEKGVPLSQIHGRTFNPALAVNSDHEEFEDWYNVCVSSDSVANGLVPGSIIYYGIHRLGKTIWLYDPDPDDNDPNGVANISNNKHVMDDYACLNKLLREAYSKYRCYHVWDEGIVRTVMYDSVAFERTSTCTKCGQIKIEDLTPLSNDIEVSGLKPMYYTGTELTPSLVVKLGDKTLEENEDYKVTYENNTKIGTANVIITGIGEYFGTVIRTFDIILGVTSKVRLTNVASGIKVSWEKVEGVKYYKVYRGDTWFATTSKLEATDTAVKSNNGIKYIYKVVASTTKNDSSGDAAKYRTSTGYRLIPVGIKSLTSPSAGKMTVTYDKNARSSGYVVRYGLNSDMSDAKVITVSGADTVSRTFSGLAKGRTYYVQVRTYKLENGTRYYSGYCTTKSVTIKK